MSFHRMKIDHFKSMRATRLLGAGAGASTALAASTASFGDVLLLIEPEATWLFEPPGKTGALKCTACWTGAATGWKAISIPAAGSDAPAGLYRTECRQGSPKKSQ